MPEYWIGFLFGWSGDRWEFHEYNTIFILERWGTQFNDLFGNAFLSSIGANQYIHPNKRLPVLLILI